MKLEGKNILITGGSLGIGKETAKYLVDKGANVLITGRSQDRLDEAQIYTGAKVILFDVSDCENISKNANLCLDIFGGRVDALINNAGIGSFDKLDDITLEQFQTIFNTNVFGLALLTKELIPSMKSRKFGTIINIRTFCFLCF